MLTNTKCFLILVFILIAWCGQAQKNLFQDKIVWHLSEKVDLYSGKIMSYQAEITTTPNRLTLKSTEGEMFFDVSNVTGNWIDPEKNGNITFELPVSKGVEKATLESRNGELSITIDLLDRKDGMKKKFIIDNYTL